MPLTANRELSFFVTRELIELPVDDNVVIYKGALVGRNRATGLARGLVAGDDFLGVAYRKADNTQPGHTAGGISVRLHQAIDMVHTLSGVATGDIGKDVFALDDQTLTLNPLNASRVGRVVAIEGTNLARVRCQPVTEIDGVLDNRPFVQLPDANVTLTLDHMNRVLTMSNTTARTVTLPSVASVRAGAWFRLIKTSAAAFQIVVIPQGGQTIDGGPSYTAIDANYDAVHVVCTGSEWVIFSRDIA